MVHHLLSIALLILLTSAGLAAPDQRSLQNNEPEDLPPTLIMEQKNDAQQVLLIQVTNAGTATDIFETDCGSDTYYEYAATVLGVSRTVEPGATALGAETVGEVMAECHDLKFKTYEKDWPEEGCPGAVPDPGRLEEGACGTIYLTPAPGGGPYVLAVGGKNFFEAEEDKSVCEEIMKQCEEKEKEMGSNDPNDPNASSSNGGVAVSVASSVTLALLPVVALW